MAISRWQRFCSACHPYQAWRFAVLNVKILKGVDTSKRLSPFRVKYKVHYVVPGSGLPSLIANGRKPPEVGERVRILETEVEVVEVRQMMHPRGEFSFLEAIGRTLPPV